MRVFRAIVTVVEHDGRRWLCGADGKIIAEVDDDVMLCDEYSAISSVFRAIQSERHEFDRLAKIMADDYLMEPWDAVLTAAIYAVRGATLKLGIVQDAWNRRIESAAKACYLMVRRGSNRRERTKHESQGGTWEGVIASAYQRATIWAGSDEWDIYSRDLASNNRKRFRECDP